MPLFSGRLAERTLAQVLGQVLLSGKSGVLKVSLGNLIRQLFIEKGRVLRYAASNLMAESLTEHLKRIGRYNADQMRRATAGKQANELLSSALVRLGFLTAEENSQLVGEMIEKVVVSIAAWKDASYQYLEGELPFAQSEGEGLRLPVVILGLARRSDRLEALRRTLGERNLKLKLNPFP